MISIIASGSNHVYNSSTSCFMSMVMELKCVFCFSWSKYGDPLFQCFMILHIQWFYYVVALSLVL